MPRQRAGVGLTGAAPTAASRTLLVSRSWPQRKLGHSPVGRLKVRSGIPGLDLLGSRSHLDAARQASDRLSPRMGVAARLAAAIDDPETPPYALAAMSRELRALITTLPGAHYDR
jgi:hypothetical protein